MKLKSFLLITGKVMLLFAVFWGLMGLTSLLPAECETVNGYATSDVVYADGSMAHFDDKILAE